MCIRDSPISVQPKVKLDFGMQLTAKAWFIDAKAEFGMGKWEWPNANKMMLMSSDASDLQLMERDDEKPSEFFPHEISMFSTGNQVGDNNTKILSNVFPSVQAQPVTVNGKDILLFTNDNIARETQNGLTLMYSEKAVSYTHLDVYKRQGLQCRQSKSAMTRCAAFHRRAGLRLLKCNYHF